MTSVSVLSPEYKELWDAIHSFSNASGYSVARQVAVVRITRALESMGLVLYLPPADESPK